MDDEAALQWLRDRESRFFGGGKFNPLDAVLLIEREALDTGVEHVAVERRGGWWLIWSKQDWLGGTDAARVFRAIVHNPHGGPNNLHVEVLLRAFARDVITWSHGDCDIVQGTLNEEVETAVTSLPAAERIVAFKE